MKIYSNKKRTKRGMLLGLLIAVAGPMLVRRQKNRHSDLKDADFRSSTRKMGLTFTERIRDHFRPGWLRRG